MKACKVLAHRPGITHLFPCPVSLDLQKPITQHGSVIHRALLPAAACFGTDEGVVVAETPFLVVNLDIGEFYREELEGFFVTWSFIWRVDASFVLVVVNYSWWLWSSQCEVFRARPCSGEGAGGEFG